MGFETFFLANPENNLYAWMQKVFPDYATWLYEQLAQTDPYMMRFFEPQLLKIIRTLQGKLPTEIKFRQQFSHCDVAELFSSIYFDYSAYLSSPIFGQLEEIAYIRKELAFYHFSNL